MSIFPRINWLLAFLVAALCGTIILLLIIFILTPGYLLRALGTILVNLADQGQRKIMRLVSWTDRKLSS